MAEHDNDQVDIWRSLREISKHKRAANTVSSTELLRQSGVAFTSHNGGIHLKVQAGRLTVDFWPSTGLWLIPGGKQKRRGVDRLIAYARQQGAMHG